MREILFRGKRVDNGEWVCGYYAYCTDGCEFSHRIYIIPAETYGGETLHSVWFEVLPETIGQYTGLTDKNGKKIFEGDIVESRASENKEDWKAWQVNFEDGSFVFDSVRKSVKSRRKYKYEQNLLCVDEIQFYGLVQIGNIHDNPELLKGGAE